MWNTSSKLANQIQVKCHIGALSIIVLQFFVSTVAYDKKYLSNLLSNKSLIDNGETMQNVSLFNLRHNKTFMEEFSVRCLINVENWTSWNLTDPLAHNHCGYIHQDYPASAIRSGLREIIIGHKQGGTATGSCGTISWQIENLDTRLIVMWSVPFNFNLHDAYFAVGMIFNRGKFSSSSYWFNQMYYSEKGPYKRGEAGETITYENSAVIVHGHMEHATYHPILNISVVPQVKYKLASSVWHRLYNSKRSTLFPTSNAAKNILPCENLLSFSILHYLLHVCLMLTLKMS